MPRVTFTPEHKKANPFDYPKLMLEKGERARVVAIEPQPLMEYVHTMRAPKLDSNGQVVMREVKRRGEVKMEPDYEFVGRHVCVGDINTIDQRGSDPESCPVCEAATKTDAVSSPDRRFGAHLVRYALQPGSFEIQSPFQVTLIAWTFSDKVFNTLVDLATEWGDLRQRDLMLGPCEVKQFQKFDIRVAASAEWLQSEERKAMVADLFKSNRSEDMSALIARKLTREQILEDLNKVLTAHRMAFGGPAVAADAVAGVAMPGAATNGAQAGAEAAPSAPEADSGMDLASLLGETPAQTEQPAAAEPAAETPPPAQEQAAPPAEAPAEQASAEPAPEAAPAQERAAPAEQPPAASNEPSGEVLNIDDLLG